MSLERKERRPPPPKDTGALYTTLFKERYGKLGAAAAVARYWMGRKF
jgi:hypothetical protein